ncbi:MAG: cell division protein FtsZ [Candidatus Magasanikbacteria bacterium CG_4_9_14_0_2_um_filter_41_10]|uniref:Cell division protein FtsZ n=1 Tax=Candidatus Magasanikbacteria bacterium CG_4_10_14_0_2_um_filter_41_31 TaxID=1974639 RepID=A0A2M7V3H0_9BACT|nr:MAG: cell division protein FtsZ [Candidatus Magasanikbacteria bacterium CG1_02_41_34]PIZ93040.1 MAG: cell division protein FtsZ [Candidatus Magasanikbacteria bacterium CG_4_10_14_0_2_um_filter_41_31]PJC53881.1 MAG: cell division protein FtsZ [Candidatus Magasanikbacteria bacterium CG_4_9_14_0_2_um_filter_41_10]
MPQVKPEVETIAKIKVIGVGGSGGSAIDRMVKADIRGVDFIVMNTDVQALHHNSAPHKLHIGKTVTRGLGAGMNPEVGQRSAEESQNEIREALKETDMVFITCGLGGGTGSGASPVIAEIAREMGALTVGVVTKPFSFEGPQRKAIADKAYRELARHVDTIITIPNDRVLQIIDKKTSLLDAFKIVDDVLRQGVQGISELITVPGLINVDFADVKSIMKDRGSALMGIGIGSGDTRAVEAAQAAISSPLLEVSIDGARGILFTITGGTSLGMQEVAEAAKIITNSADDDVRVIFGAIVDETMGEDVRVTVIATGFEEAVRPSRGKDFDAEDDLEELHAPFPLKKPMYSNNLFSKRKMSVHEEETEHEKESIPPVRNNFTSKPVSAGNTIPTRTATSLIPQKSADQSEEEDLEIPAFIRKKMGM